MEDQIAALDHSAYHCDVILDKDVFVGIIFYWKTARYCYIEHFAIDPDMRGNSMGSRCLKQFCEMNHLVILEIDPDASRAFCHFPISAKKPYTSHNPVTRFTIRLNGRMQVTIPDGDALDPATPVTVEFVVT